MLDELNDLALMRARDEARALLKTATAAMIETDRPARLALVALLAGGHLLVEDVPGTGKTTLARIVSRAIGGHDSRIQCTPDIGPNDVLGQMVRGERVGEADRFEPGPIFANAVVLDEINRATTRLQSALFEAMEEKFVSLAGRRHVLPKPFFVVATMNPFSGIDEHSRLSHGQRDRFAIATGIGYPSARGERELLRRYGRYDAVAQIDPIVATGDVVRLQQTVDRVQVPDPVLDFLVEVVRATREHPHVQVGASPRAALSLQRCCQALALLEDTRTVTPEQVAELTGPCLAHRLEVRPGYSAHAVCDEVLQRVRQPQWTGPQRGDLDLSRVETPVVGAGGDLPTVSSLELRVLERLRRSELRA